jgi:hypothetical protein
MMMTKTWRHVALAGLVCAMLSGCGGDSGPWVNLDPPLNPTTPTDTGGTGTGTGTVPVDPMVAALASGDASQLTPAMVGSYVRTLIANVRNNNQVASSGIVSSTNGAASAVVGASWLPNNTSVTLKSNNLKYVKVLVSTAGASFQSWASTAGLTLGLASAEGDWRHAVLGSNPIYYDNVAKPSMNAAMDEYMRRLVVWLTAGKAPAKIVMANVPERLYYYWLGGNSGVPNSGLRGWLSAKFGASNITVNGKAMGAAYSATDCSDSRLSSCLDAGADLLIVSNEAGDPSAMVTALQRAQREKIPTLFLKMERDPAAMSTAMLNFFQVSEALNYWSAASINGADLSVTPVDADLESASALVNRLTGYLGAKFTSWRVADQAGLGPSQGMSGDKTVPYCYFEVGRVKCQNVTVHQDEVLTPLQRLRSSLAAFESQGLSLFAQPTGYQLEKSMVLLGDTLRAQVASYPIAGPSTDAGVLAFSSSLAADYLNYNVRGFTRRAASLGTFADVNRDVSAPVQTRSGSVQANGNSNNTVSLTGFYALAGRPLTITRTDSSGVTAYVRVNMIRDSTRIYNPGAGPEAGEYWRPSNIESQQIRLNSGVPLTITSPYGGLVVVETEKSTAVDKTVAFTVSNVAAHAVIDPSTASADDLAGFSDALTNNLTSWAGFNSKYLVVMSTTEKLKQSVGGYADWSTFFSVTNRYMLKDAFELAGFTSGDGFLQRWPQVATVCVGKGWNCNWSVEDYVRRTVFVADQALCGSMCSGFPIDSWSAFNPMGWGESHELGHNNQPALLRIVASDGAGRAGETSNNIFPLHKFLLWNNDKSRAELVRDGLSASTPEPSVFTQMKTAASTSDPQLSVYNWLWSGGNVYDMAGQRLDFYRQLPEVARYYNPTRFGQHSSDGGAVDAGWSIYPMLYIAARNFEAAKGSDALWNGFRSQFGFGSYGATRADLTDSLNTLLSNDFMLIESSFLIERDMRPYFDMWGIYYSSAASDSVAAMGYAAAGKIFFPAAAQSAKTQMAPIFPATDAFPALSALPGY